MKQAETIFERSPEEHSMCMKIKRLDNNLHIIKQESRPYHGPQANMSPRKNYHDVSVHQFHEDIILSSADCDTLKKLLMESRKIYLGPLLHDTQQYSFNVDKNKAFAIYQVGKEYPIHDLLITLPEDMKNQSGLADYERVMLPAKVTKKDDYKPAHRLLLAICDLQCSEEMFAWFVEYAQSEKNQALVLDPVKHQKFIENLLTPRKAKIIPPDPQVLGKYKKRMEEGG